MTLRSQTCATATIALTAVALLAGCGGRPSATATAKASGSPAGSACTVSSGDVKATTATFTMVLGVGPPEMMYSQEQVNSQHLTSGEVMLGGAMSDASGPNVRHVEVHMCDRATGAVVSGGNPTITLQDTTAGTPPQSLPVAAMEGVAQGDSDYHYGNNAVLRPGHEYTVTVTMRGEKATLQYKAG